MDLFLQIVLSFPTLVFTIALLVALGFWLLSLLGLFESDVLNLSIADGVELEPGALPGVLAKVGFDGLPLTLVLTAVAFFSWVLSYFGTLLLLALDPGWLRVALAVAVFVLAFLISIPLSGLALHPLRGLFARHEAPGPDALLARTAIVRSDVVDDRRGTAFVDDGGAGLILQVRAPAGHFRRGDAVVLVEYVPEANVWRVIAPEG